MTILIYESKDQLNKVIRDITIMTDDEKKKNIDAYSISTYSWWPDSFISTY